MGPEVASRPRAVGLFIFLIGRVGPEVTSMRQIVARHYDALTQDIVVRGYDALTRDPRRAARRGQVWLSAARGLIN